MASYYNGKVVKLLWNGNHGNKVGYSTWQVLDVMEIDTNNDNNIHINLSHLNLRATFLPVTQIKDFSDSTTTVSRFYNSEQHTEHWAAV